MTVIQPKIWTYEDYLALPDDGNRYEIIEGELFVTPSPNRAHQKAVLKLSRYMDEFVTEQEIGEVFTAPYEVHLSEHTRPVQPDVFFIRTERLPEDTKATYFEIAPDLVVEVLSPSTAKLDRTAKFRAYQQVGVQEYWIIDPDKGETEIFALQEEEYVKVAHFAGNDVITSEVLAGFTLRNRLLFYVSTKGRGA